MVSKSFSEERRAPVAAWGRDRPLRNAASMRQGNLWAPAFFKWASLSVFRQASETTQGRTVRAHDHRGIGEKTPNRAPSSSSPAQPSLNLLSFDDGCLGWRLPVATEREAKVAATIKRIRGNCLASAAFSLASRLLPPKGSGTTQAFVG